MSWLAGFAGDLAGNLLGKLGSTAIDLKASEKLIKAQLQAQKDLFQFENENKHQFEVGDLRAAGLNPILSATNGSAVSVGGVSAPNWSSDDDLYSPSAARQLQREQMSIQKTQAEAQYISSLANLENSRTGGLRNSAEAVYFDERSETERQMRENNIKKVQSEVLKNTKEGQRAEAQVGEIISNIPVNREKANHIAQEATGQKLRNDQIKEMNIILKDPKYDKGMFKAALAYSLATGKNWDQALAYAISKSAVDKTVEVEDNLPKNNASSAAAAFDNYDSLYEYGGVRE